MLLKTYTPYCNVEGELGDDLVGVAENHEKTISMTNIKYTFT